MDLPVNALADFLIAVYQIAFDHESFHHIADIRIVAAGVQDFFANTALLQIIFTRVRMIAVDD